MWDSLVEKLQCCFNPNIKGKSVSHTKEVNLEKLEDKVTFFVNTL